VNDQLRRRSVGAPAARSALLTVLGEYVLPTSGSAWQETLISALGGLDYKPQAARQALARSIADGWLRPERRGRRSRVHLTADTAAMLTSGAERIYSFGQPWEWDGQWLLIVLRVPEQSRHIRHRIRTQLAWAGFGSLGGGVYVSPHVEREAELRTMADGNTAAELQSFHARFGEVGNREDVVATAWDLDAVAKTYEDFIARFQHLRPKTPEGVFQAQTRLVHAWRKFPFLDPDLPETMLPRGWPRSKAHALFETKHATWHDTALDYFASLDSVAEPARTHRLRAA
jgi:phenylacetic acid degradation operon negative regulatory protein